MDTAGLRRKVGKASGTEYYASLRTAGAIEAAEVAVVLLDASEAISEQDQRVLTMVTEPGRALVIAFNKWDLVDDGPAVPPGQGDRTGTTPHPVGDPGERVGQDRPRGGQARPGAATALASWEQRIPTGQLNQWLTALVQATPHPVRGGRAPRVLFATQAGTAPAAVHALHHRQLDPGYVRFVERQLREEFGFQGSPISITVKPRKKQGRSLIFFYGSGPSWARPSLPPEIPASASPKPGLGRHNSGQVVPSAGS